MAASPCENLTMRLTGLAVVALMLLTGCTPSTDTARRNCYSARIAPFAADKSLSLNDYTAIGIQVSQSCEAEAKANPAAFIAMWGK